MFTFGQVFLKDTDERACAYIAGPAPNRWGFTVDGDDLLDSINNTLTSDSGFLLHIILVIAIYYYFKINV